MSRWCPVCGEQEEQGALQAKFQRKKSSPKVNKNRPASGGVGRMS